MTGTPVENRWRNFGVKCTLPSPVCWAPRAFAETYGTPMESGDAEAGAGLRRRIRPFLLRRKKEEVRQNFLHGHK